MLIYSVIFLISVQFLHGTEGAYSRFTQTSRYQPFAISSCNNSQQIVPAPSQINQAGNSDYMRPTILNFNPNRFPTSQSSENENDIDIGMRINSPISLTPNTPAQTWIPNRMKIPDRIMFNQNLLNLETETQKLMDVENRVNFFLFTKENPIVAQQIKVFDKNSVNESNFLSSRPTKLIFHGFTDVDAPGEWINVMKESYLSVSDVNVIVADFSAFSLPNLLRTSLPIFASKRLAEFILFLETESGASRQDFHVIARSYATHVVGMTGRTLEGEKLGRITALEPSMKIAINGAPQYQLEKGDASFVDVVHVNGRRYFFHGGRFGLTAPFGHVDVYPNFAEKGLGCPGESRTLRRFSLRFCHLGRGVKYFTTSIKYQNVHPMCACESFDQYQNGLCGCSKPENMTFMGEYLSNQTRGIFQLAPEPQQNPVFLNTRYYSPLYNLRDMQYRI